MIHRTIINKMRISKQKLKQIIQEELTRLLRETTELGLPLLTRGELRTMSDEDLENKMNNIDPMADPTQNILLKTLETEKARRDQMKQLQARRTGGPPRGGSTIPVEEASGGWNI